MGIAALIAAATAGKALVDFAVFPLRSREYDRVPTDHRRWARSRVAQRASGATPDLYTAGCTRWRYGVGARNHHRNMTLLASPIGTIRFSIEVPIENPAKEPQAVDARG